MDYSASAFPPPGSEVISAARAAPDLSNPGSL